MCFSLHLCPKTLFHTDLHMCARRSGSGVRLRWMVVFVSDQLTTGTFGNEMNWQLLSCSVIKNLKEFVASSFPSVNICYSTMLFNCSIFYLWSWEQNN